MAQIVTITNPLTGQPAQVDQLDHTAQQIDDATARALSGGVIDQLLAGKAPAGYGLGNNYGSALPNGDFDQATKNGWYYIASDYPTNGPDGVPCGNAVLRVDRYSEIEQTLYLGTSGYQGCIMRRYYHTGLSAWQPWEWVNPRMAEGVEYRTTERYNGKPVYTKIISFGNLPNNTTKDITWSESGIVSDVIHASVITSNGALIGGVSLSGAEFTATRTNIYIKTTGDYSSTAALFLLKYTKMTD